MTRYILHRLLRWAYRRLFESRTVDATTLSPEFILKLGPSAPAPEWEPCKVCGVLKRGRHTCPPRAGANVVKISAATRKRSR
jgi:hypothetical protein